jgi:hypothetical protein
MAYWSSLEISWPLLGFSWGSLGASWANARQNQCIVRVCLMLSIRFVHAGTFWYVTTAVLRLSALLGLSWGSLGALLHILDFLGASGSSLGVLLGPRLSCYLSAWCVQELFGK